MADEEAYAYSYRIPTPDECVTLRSFCGLPRTYDPELLKYALPRSAFSVVVQHTTSGSIVGMSRVIGDGLFYQVTDVVVNKEHQGRKLGKGIMGHIVKFLETTALHGAYVSLFADGQAYYKLYQQFGFELTGEASLGMFRRF